MIVILSNFDLLKCQTPLVPYDIAMRRFQSKTQFTKNQARTHRVSFMYKRGYGLPSSYKSVRL